MPERVLDIHALTPLLWRDGRPFSLADGAETAARSLPLPLPSTVAGFVRTQLGKKQGVRWKDDYQKLKNLHGLQVCSPLLARCNSIVLPAPRDALIYKKDGQDQVMRLKPRDLKQGEGTNLPDRMLPLAVCENVKAESGYSLWSKADMTNWLLGKDKVPQQIESLSLDSRIHVGIDRDKGKAKEGVLYSVAYRALESMVDGQHVQWSIRARTSLSDGDSLESIGTLGGEARPVSLTVSDQLSQDWFDCPGEIKTAFRDLNTRPMLRMVLATPALFEQGWKPGWLEKFEQPHLPRGLSKVKLKLVSAAVGRREPVSGWNLRENCPKAVRWMVPAGSVYFFEVQEGDASAVLESWLRPVSDNEQDRKDGFGLALWGVC